MARGGAGAGRQAALLLLLTARRRALGRGGPWARALSGGVPGSPGGPPRNGQGAGQASGGPPRTTSASWPPDLSKSLMGQDGADGRVVNRIESGLDLLRREQVIDEYLRGILSAQGLVYDAAVETDLLYAHALSEALGNNIYIKREDQQPVHSFKLRGAYNKIASLPRERLEKGIVACSAGNHAQGVALAAKKLGIDAIIVMPLATPSIKIDNVRKHGGNVLLHGMNYDEAQAKAMQLAEEGRTLIHPFDDPQVIQGQGTIGMEIVRQMPNKHKKDFDAIFACVGGGGLLAGVSVYMKKVMPEVQMIGVEAKDAAGMTASLEAGKVVTLDQVGLFADGASVRTVGRNTFALIKELADGMITCTTDEICQAIKIGFNETRGILEPAGALGIAGLVRYVRTTGVRGKTLVAIASGANMDFDRLRFVSERADSSENLVSVSIPEVRGAFWTLYKQIYPRNVTEFSYRFDPLNSDGRAKIILNFQAKSPEDRTAVLDQLLSNEEYEVIDFADNDLAKTHIRYLAGGRAMHAGEERLFRLEFPERPGSLHDFLQRLNQAAAAGEDGFNVSLFHYRNHGADVGRVLVGFLVHNEAHSQALDAFLSQLGFFFVEETANEAYRNFLLQAVPSQRG